MKLINKILLSILVLVIVVPLSFGIDGIVKERHLREQRAMFQQNHMGNFLKKLLTVWSMGHTRARTRIHNIRLYATAILLSSILTVRIRCINLL